MNKFVQGMEVKISSCFLIEIG